MGKIKNETQYDIGYREATEYYKPRIESLENAMRIAEAQYMGAGGHLAPDEVVDAMRRILRLALGSEPEECSHENAFTGQDTDNIKWNGYKVCPKCGAMIPPSVPLEKQND